MYNRSQEDIQDDTVSAADDYPVEEANGVIFKRPRLVTTSPMKRGSEAAAFLEIFKDMPVDIFHEILQHLEPLDLLSLSRTTKFLRGTVLKPSMVKTWQIALDRAGLPLCPPSMNEIRYTEFMLNTVCDYCLKQGEIFRCWTASIKSCGDCTETSGDFLPIPYWTLIRSQCQAEIVSWRKHGQPLISVLGTQYYTHMEWKEKLSHDYKEWDKWVASSQVAMSNILKEMAPLKEWFKRKEEAERLEQERLKKARYEYALEMLESEGWGPEVAFLSEEQQTEMKKLKCIDLPAPIGEQEWTQTDMKSQVVDFIEQARRTRLEREHIAAQTERLKLLEDVVHDFIKSKPIQEILPLPADFAIMPEFVELIKSPTENIVTKDDISSIFNGSVDALVKRWREECDAALLTLIRHTGVEMKKTELDTEGLTTMFKCYNCQSLICYPQVLVHECASSAQFKEDDSDRTFNRIIWDATKTVPWNFGDCFRFDSKGTLRAKWLKEKYGFGFGVEELLKIPLFECLDCRTASRRAYRVFMTWNSMLTHHETPRHPLEERGYQLMKEEDAHKLLKHFYLTPTRLYKHGYSVGGGNWPKNYICTRCHLVPATKGATRKEFDKHDEKCFPNESGNKLRERVDFVPHLDILSAKLYREEEVFKLSVLECRNLGLEAK